MPKRKRKLLMRSASTSGPGMSTSIVPVSGVKTHQKRWTSEEDQAFLDALNFCGYGKWTQIARVLGNRTALQVKNRARHLILYETGSELSEQLRALAGTGSVKPLVKAAAAYSPVSDESGSDLELDTDSSEEESAHSQVLEEEDFVNVVESSSVTPFYTETSLHPSPTINPSLIASPPSIISSPMPIRPNIKVETIALPTPSPSPSFDASEHMLNSDFISERERLALPEFFQGNSSTRTPERFLKIRSTILRLWIQHRPQNITKLAARVALRGIAGDVGLISKVHGFLEESNLINIAPPRPKSTTNNNLISSNRITRSTKPKEEQITVRTAASVPLTYRRPRTRALGLDPFELMRLSEPQEGFCIHFSHLVFTLIHIHAFLSRQEVIGVLGGCQKEGMLQVTQVYPCKSQVSSGMECEMDPFAEMRACELFSQRGCSMIGWYHSHPTFPSNPSRRDLETQSLYQKLYECPPCSDCITTTMPSFIGAIVSPWGNKREGIELTCFQSNPTPVNGCVNGQSIKWMVQKDTDFDSEQWHKAFRELYEVEGVPSVPQSDRTALLNYLILKIPFLEAHWEDLEKML